MADESIPKADAKVVMADESIPKADAKTVPAGYGQGRDYWDKRYEKNPKPFEWLESYEEIKATLEGITGGNRNQKIMNVGCGTSPVCEEMYDDGYVNIANMDLSPVCIEAMRGRNKGRPEMTWEEMDATNMKYEDDMFDIVLDKGTLDTLACAPDRYHILPSYVKEILRVLKPGGVWLCVSYGKQETRVQIFEDPRNEMSVSIEHFDVGPNHQNHAYIVRRDQQVDVS